MFRNSLVSRMYDKEAHLVMSKAVHMILKSLARGHHQALMTRRNVHRLTLGSFPVSESEPSALAMKTF